MLTTFLNFIWTLACTVLIVFICYSIWLWLDKKTSKETSCKVVCEYMMFILARDHTNGSFKFESWERLKALGADGWEIAQTLESDYDSISYILKRETFYQSWHKPNTNRRSASACKISAKSIVTT